MKILPLFIIALLTLCLPLFMSSVFAYSSKTITVGSSPAGIAINTKTKEVYVADSSGDSNSISVINASNNMVIKTIKAGLEPLGIAVNENTNMIYIADFGESKVSVVNGTDNRLVANVTVGFQPGKIRVNPITNMIYAIQQGADDHSISVINGTTNLFVKKIELGSFETTGIDVDAQKNLVYVTYRINPGGNQTAIGEVSVIDGKTNTIVKTIQVGSAPQDIAVNPNTNMIYVTDDASENDVLSINGITYQIVNTIPLPAYPTGLGVNTRTNTIFAANEDNNTVSMINGTDDSFVSTISGFNCPTFIGMNSNKSEIYVNNYCSNTVRKIDVTCKEGLQLITKAEDNSPACVKPQTAEKLASRGWTTVVAGTSDNSVTKTAYNDIDKPSGIILLGNQPYYMTTFNDTLDSIPSSGADISFHGVLFTLLRPLVSNANGDLYEVDVKFTSDNTNESLVIYPVGVGAVQQDRVLSKHTLPQVGFLVYQRNAIKLLVSTDANSPNIQTQNGNNTTLSSDSTTSANQTYYPVYQAHLIRTINASSLPPIRETPPPAAVSTTPFSPITEPKIINYSNPNATKILAVGMYPNPLKVGDIVTFTVTYQNISDKPIYGITGCGSDLTPIMEPSIKVQQFVSPRQCAQEADSIQPNQVITDSSAPILWHKIIQPGLLNVTLTLVLYSEVADYPHPIKDTIQFSVNATQ